MFLSHKHNKRRPYSINIVHVILLTTLFIQNIYAADTIRHVRVLEKDNNSKNPAGIAFSRSTNVFYVLEKSDKTVREAATISKGTVATRGIVSAARVTARERTVGGNVATRSTGISTVHALEQRSSRPADIGTAITDPSNTTFDSKNNRLLMYQAASNTLITVNTKPNGDLDATTLTRHDVSNFGVQNPRGITVNPATGNLFILDLASTGSRIVRVDLDTGKNIENATTTQIDLQASGISNPQALAFDPTNDHLHVFSSTDQKLFELTLTGKVLTSHDISKFNLSDAQSMVVAPSGDLTDSPSQMSLYVVSRVGENTSSRFVSELSFVTAQVATALLPNFTSIEVKTTDTSIWIPPSPDPAGITYLPNEGKLLISDSEVNEITDPNLPAHYQGANLFKTALTGNLLDTSNTLAYSAEPTGVVFKADPDPTKERIFVSDDNIPPRVFVLRAGTDGLFGTIDDALVTQFRTDKFDINNPGVAKSFDPEGVTFDSSGQGTLFIADGLNNEIYKVTPGPNGVFDGIDDVVTSFDTLSLGVLDPEGITFDTNTGHLYIVGEPQINIAKVSTNGVLVQNIDITDAYSSTDLTRTPAGLAFAPGSLDPAVMNIFVANRAKDNGPYPAENDGRLIEMTLPIPVNSPPVAADDSYSGSEGAPLNIAAAGVLDNDIDTEANPLTAILNDGPVNGTLTLNTDGSFTYTPNPDFAGIDSFTYHANDGNVDSNIATVTLTITAIPCP